MLLILIYFLVTNNDRAIPYRVKVTARWTVMPTVTYPFHYIKYLLPNHSLRVNRYNDVVVFLNENESTLSVNVVEVKIIFL